MTLPYHVDVDDRWLHRAAHAQLQRLPAADADVDARVELHDGVGRQVHLELCHATYRHHAVDRRDGEARERVRIKHLQNEHSTH